MQVFFTGTTSSLSGAAGNGEINWKKPAAADFCISAVENHRRIAVSKIRSDISAPEAARLTGKQRLKIRRPDIIRPVIGTDRCVMAASIIGAIDQDAAQA